MRGEAGECAEVQYSVVNMLKSLRDILVDMPKTLRDEAWASNALRRLLVPGSQNTLSAASYHLGTVKME